MRKGAIVLVPFPFTNLSGQKVRPALVLAVSRGNSTLAFISSIAKRQGIFDVGVIPSPANGLKAASTIRLDKLATLQRTLVIGSIGHLESRHLAESDAKLKKYFRL